MAHKLGQLHRWWIEHRMVVLAVASVGAVAVVILLAWPVTDLLAAHDVGRLTGMQRALHLQAARETVRTELLTLGAGIFAAGALVFTGRTYGLTRRVSGLTAQVQAVEQLGSETPEIRIAAIYTLEKVALDFPRDQPTVMEILAAFTRQHAGEAGFVRDVHAAITVIGRRRPKGDSRPLDPGVPIDLGTADLRNAVFAKHVPAPKGWRNVGGRLMPLGEEAGSDQPGAAR